jgi:hypothetical protein
VSSDKRKAAFAIGVSDAPPLPYLGGAVNGARTFAEWATAQGYDTRLVTDESERVTVARVREALEGLFAAGAPDIHRLLIYFAGHGIIREVEEGLWLLSDWSQELRAVAVEALRRRLSLYRVEQVAIFADACRSLPADVDTADLVPEAVLGRGPGPRSATVAVDKFVAAQDGTRTFMIPGPSPEDDRCLFSGVLLEGLWGTKPDAFSTVLPGKVTSRSLGKFLQDEVPLIAATYQSTVMPSVSPTFPEGDDVYFGDGPSITPPAFPPWPVPDNLLAWGPLRSGAPPHDPEAQVPTPDTALENRLRAQERPVSFESRSGFAIAGAAVVRFWAPSGIVAEIGHRPDWWRIRPGDTQRLERPVPVLIELANGTVAAATALPDFVASILATERGVAALVYREVSSPHEVASVTEGAIGSLERGGLRADAVTDLAVALRHGKHADPVRGVISAYLYDSIGDIDSIRRMASFYVRNGPAIPYDIALLAELRGERGPDGRLRATVPAVAAREPRTDGERHATWTYERTREASGEVAGHWPWLRQGWAFLDDAAADGSALVLPGLTELDTELTSARFTTFHQSGAQRLVTLFDLK